MAIISESKPNGEIHYGNAQFRYAMVYVLVTMVVLSILNIYTSRSSERLIYESKKSSMVEKCLLAGNEIANLDILNPANAAAVMAQISSLNAERIIITDQAGQAVYDSRTEDSALGRYVLLPEIVQAMNGNDVFIMYVRDGMIRSHAAVPIVSNDTMVGCVYITESDAGQGTLIRNLRSNVFTITLIMEMAVLLFSIIYSQVFSGRLQKIMQSMRVIQEGDYSHKVNLGGKDELTFLADEFNDLTERLQSSERKRSQFVSDASHELKTPLASIKLLSDSILQNDMDMATVREFVEDIGNEAERLNRMTLKLLSLSRVESQEDGDCEIVSLVPTALRVVRMLGEIAAKNGITIVTELEEDYPILILEDDLYQIIFNLAENGIKYNVSGGTLTLSLHRDQDNAVLEVRDTGMGIPADALPHVFERFFRVDKARARQSGGSGLGLAIVRSMVERNNGTISVTSVPGEGSCFTLSFPIFDTEEPQ